MPGDEIVVRRCAGHKEFGACVELQRAAWEFNDLDLVPKEIFIVAAKTGGQVFGAFENDRQVGFVLAVPAIQGERLLLHSHMLAVEPAFRDRGVGRRLKLMQREDALERGIDLIEWTFDPLALKNAYLNLNRLGIIARRYIPDQYGTTSSPLHAGAPTDRLLAEWWLRSPRVKDLLAGRTTAAEKTVAEIRIPAEIDRLRREDPAQIIEIQSDARQKFEQGFSQGLAVTGFRLDDTHGTYLLTHYED